MKRILALLLCALMAMPMLAGVAVAEEKVHLSFITTEAATDEKLAYFEALIQDFIAENPNVEIELIHGGSANDVETKLNAASLSNTYPDMILVTLIALGSRASLGEWTDLAPFIEKWEDKDDIYQAAIDIGLYEGKNCAIGVYPVPEIVAYRKDYFEEAGLDPQQPPKTWDELYAYAQKLVQYDENGDVVRSGFDVPVSDSNLTMFEAFLRQAGGDVVDAQTGELMLDSEATVNALSFMKKFIDEKLTPVYTRGSGDPISMNASAMGIIYPDTALSLIAENPDLADKLGFFPYVSGERAGSFSGYRIFAISETSEHKEEAWKFYELMMEGERMWERLEKFNSMPVRYSLEEQYIALNPEMNEAMVECVKVGKGRPALSWVSTLSKNELSMYEEVMYGVKTPEQALADCLANIEAERALMGN